MRVDSEKPCDLNGLQRVPAGGDAPLQAGLMEKISQSGQIISAIQPPENLGIPID
jgi:hypothetical protein